MPVLAILFATVIISSSCAVPLAPGYHAAAQTREITLAPAARTIQVHDTYKLTNTGANDLSFVDVELPETNVLGRKSLHIDVNGQSSEANQLPGELRPDTSSRLRIPMANWTKKESRILNH